MTAVSLPAVPTRAAIVPGRTLLRILVAVLFALLTIQLVCTCRSAMVLIPYPFGLDYGEGIVWQQMRDIARGHAYGPLGTYPAIVYHYPPVYHLVAAALARVAGMDELAAGRLVSWLATLGTAIGLAALAWRMPEDEEPRVRAATAALAGLLFLGTGPVMHWSVAMRVDMLAGLFGVAGLLAALAALRRGWLVHVAALLFVLAVYTKQVSIAAPAAAFLGLLAVRPALAWRLLATSMLGGLILLGGLCWATHGRFLDHVLFYNVNRFSREGAAELLHPAIRHAASVALAGIGAWALARRLHADWTDRACHADRVAAAVTLLAFLTLKTAMLPMMLKSGANTNYLVEWFEAVAVCAALGATPALRAALGSGPSDKRHPRAPAQAGALEDVGFARQRSGLRRSTGGSGGEDQAPGTDAGARPSPFAAALLLLLTLQSYGLIQSPVTQAQASARAAPLRRLAAAIRRAPAPVISDEMTLLIRAGRDVTWEPAIAAELGAAGRYDQRGFARLVRQRRFAAFITDGEPGTRLFDSRYNPPVAAAITQAYPVRHAFAGLIIHLPRASGGALTPPRP